MGGVEGEDMNAATRPRSADEAMEPQPAFTVQVLKGVEQIAAIAGEWDELFQRAGQPQQVFQTRAFLDLWTRHYHEPRSEIIVVTGRVDGRLAALLPLVKQRRLGLSVLRLMGLPVAQFSDCIAEPDVPPELVQDIWTAVKNLGADLLEARRVRADAALLRIAPDATAEFEHHEAPFADLGVRVVDGEAGEAYSSKYRSNLRRRLRRLAELGDVKFVGNPPMADARLLAVTAISIKRLWLRQHDLRSAAVQDDRFLGFFADAANDPEIGMQVSAITLDGTPVAIDLSFACKGTCFGHVLATDPAREEQGVGGMMVHQAFAAAKANGNAVFDLLAPANEHKMGHADGVTQVASRAWAFTPTGRLACYLLLRRALPAAKGIASKLPASLVSWLGRKI